MKNLIEIDNVPLIQVQDLRGAWYHRGLDTEELQEWYSAKLKNLKGVAWEES